MGCEVSMPSPLPIHGQPPDGRACVPEGVRVSLGLPHLYLSLSIDGLEKAVSRLSKTRPCTCSTPSELGRKPGRAHCQQPGLNVAQQGAPKESGTQWAVPIQASLCCLCLHCNLLTRQAHTELRALPQHTQSRSGATGCMAREWHLRLLGPQPLAGGSPPAGCPGSRVPRIFEKRHWKEKGGETGRPSPC